MKKFRLILAFETSCDDTSVALVNGDGFVVGMKSQNQDEIHAPYGGIIPELACRNHTMRILPLLESLFNETGTDWKDIDGIAVTSKPGLVGALMVGVTVAKTFSYLYKLPLVGVNHLEGHLHAPLLKDREYGPPEDFKYPFVGLCVSGGHTSLYAIQKLGKYKLLGRTLDDAAGEAFDKFGKLLGLGYPAGAKVDGLARSGNPAAFDFPRALMKKGDFNFSFSGLKTSGMLEIQKLQATGPLSDTVKADLCASYQQAIVDVLVEKTRRAVEKSRLTRAVITGGVSANSRLRLAMGENARRWGVELIVPPPRYCTDNAAMIGLAGLLRLNKGERSHLNLSPEATVKKAELF